MLGRRCFDELVEIGERLIACRALLKGERRWLAWLKTEFSWSRGAADRFISLAQNKAKLHNLSTLVPASALYLLAKAPPAVVQTIEQRVAAGGRPSVRAVHAAIVEASPLSLSAYARNDTSPLPQITVSPTTGDSGQRHFREPDDDGQPKRFLTASDLRHSSVKEFLRALRECAWCLERFEGVSAADLAADAELLTEMYDEWNKIKLLGKAIEEAFISRPNPPRPALQ